MTVGVLVSSGMHGMLVLAAVHLMCMSPFLHVKWWGRKFELAQSGAKCVTELVLHVHTILHLARDMMHTGTMNGHLTGGFTILAVFSTAATTAFTSSGISALVNGT